jgi:sialate O-acetylesterase
VQEPVGHGYQPEQSEPNPLPDANPTTRAADLRHAFIRAMRVENTQVITSADLVGGLHPRDREGYVRRIRTAVLGFVYGDNITFAGPTYQGMSIEAGNRVRIRFRDGTATGLQAHGGPLQGFSISADGVTFVWAEAEIQGEEVVVSSDSVQAPTIVRYGYDLDYTFANLFNDADMAAPTFSTDASPFE